MINLAAAFVAGTICAFASFAIYFVIGQAWFAAIVLACAFIAAVEVAFHKLVGEALS